MRSFHTLLAAFAAMLLIVSPSAFSAEALSNPMPQARGAKIDNAWIRWLPAGVPLAGYASIVNPGDRPIVLVSASSAAFRDVSIHRSIRTDGAVRMSPVGEIAIAPHSSVDFEAEGYHLMLMQPTETLDSQSAIPITLRFADGSSVTVRFQVRKTAAR